MNRPLKAASRNSKPPRCPKVSTAKRLRASLPLIFLLAFFLPGVPARAASQEVSGVVLDQDGSGIAGARVTFTSKTEDPVATATTNPDGTFTAMLAAPPHDWSAQASGYLKRKYRFKDGQRLVATLDTAEPHEPAALSSNDLSALPYQDNGYSFSLLPFTIIQAPGGTITIGDRGLEGMANFIQASNGAKFQTVPEHYLGYAHVVTGFQSYRYQSGEVGKYSLGYDLPEGATGEIGSGSMQVVNLQQRSGDATLRVGNSRADSTQRAQFDLTDRGHFGTSQFLLTAGEGYLDDASFIIEELTHVQSARLRIKTPVASSQLVSELKSKAKGVQKIGAYNEDESEFVGELSLQHHAKTLSTDIGFIIQRSTGTRTYSPKKHSEGTELQKRAFAAAAYQGPRLFVQAALSAYRFQANGVIKGSTTPVDASVSGLAPEIRASWEFNTHLSLTLTRADAIRTPEVSDEFFGDALPVLVLQKSNLSQADLEYRNGAGAHVGTTLYGERFVSMLPTTKLHGLGFFADMPLARNWRLHAWTLAIRDYADDLTPLSDLLLQPSRGRDVVWLTYDPPTATRLDLVYRHETDTIEGGHYIDADAVIPLSEHLALVATMENHRHESSAGLALRVGVFGRTKTTSHKGP